MRQFKTSFLWQFSGGFVLGAVALLTLQPAEGQRTFAGHVSHAVEAVL
jgi:hypothetical protein